MSAELVKSFEDIFGELSATERKWLIDNIGGLKAHADVALSEENDRLIADIARNEEHYQAAMAMSEKHRRLWVEACQEREKIRAALQGFMKIGARPWIDGGVSWPEWDAAMSAAESTIERAQTSQESAR